MIRSDALVSFAPGCCTPDGWALVAATAAVVCIKFYICLATIRHSAIAVGKARVTRDLACPTVTLRCTHGRGADIVAVTTIVGIGERIYLTAIQGVAVAIRVVRDTGCRTLSAGTGSQGARVRCRTGVPAGAAIGNIIHDVPTGTPT